MSDLAAAVAANGVSLYRWMLSQVDGEADLEEEDGLLCATAALPELCVAMRTHAKPGASRLPDDDALRRIREFFAQRAITDYLVMADVPEERSFAALLEANGFRSEYEELPMVLSSAPPARVAPDTVPASRLDIRKVARDEDLTTFREIAGSVFDLYGNGDLVRTVFGSIGGLGDTDASSDVDDDDDVGPNAQAFLGFIEGQAVATTFLLMTDGVAGVYFVATLPEARGQGVADALVRHAASRAFAQGASAVVLAATQAGMSIYRRIGFVPTGTIAREFRSPKPHKD